MTDGIGIQRLATSVGAALGVGLSLGKHGSFLFGFSVSYTQLYCVSRVPLDGWYGLHLFDIVESQTSRDKYDTYKFTTNEPDFEDSFAIATSTQSSRSSHRSNQR